MNEHEFLKKSFSVLHASDETLQKVMEKADSHVRTGGISKRFAALVAVMIMVFSLALVVHATGLLADLVAILTPANNPGQVIDSAYGDGISSQKPNMEDAYGNPIEMPTMNRIDVNPEESEKLIGAYISNVDGAVTVGDNTFTLENFLIDETGSGMFVWTVENPNGIAYSESGYGMVCFSPVAPFAEPYLHQITTDGEEHMTAMETALIAKNENSTKLELVSYFGTYENYQKGDSLIWTVAAGEEKGTIQIMPNEHAPVSELKAESGLKLFLANQAATIRFDRKHEFIVERIEIRFEDGSQYLVRDREGMVMNTMGSFWRTSETNHYGDAVFQFNRLIDIDNVASVEVYGHWLESVVDGDNYSNIRHEESYIFLPVIGE